MEISDVVKSFVQSCNVQPSHDESTVSCGGAQRQLDVLNGLVGSRDLSFFTGLSRPAHECVTCCVAILFDMQPNLPLAGKVLTFLQHLAKEPRLLHWLREEFELHSALVELLQNRLVEDNTPVQLQIIELLRDVCYRYQVTMTESKIGYLSDFLFKHVESEDSELFLPCLELLNYISWSPVVQRYMCMMARLGQLCKSLVPKLVHDNSGVVMHTFAIFVNLSLDKFISDKIFSQSMKKAVQLVLCTVVSNVREAKKIAADILEDLLNNQERRAFILKSHYVVVSCAAKIAEKQVQREPDDLQTTINVLTTILSVPEFRQEFAARTPSPLQPLLSLLNGAVEPLGNSLQMAHSSIKLVLLVTQVEELRSLLRVSERRIEDSQEKMDTLERRNEDTVQTLKASKAKIKAMKGHIEDLEQRNNDLDMKAKRLEVVLKSLDSAQQEIQSQAEMIAMLQKHGDTLKLKFDALTKTNEELELANQNQEKVIKEHEAKMKDQAKCLHILQGKLEDKSTLVKSLAAEKSSLHEAGVLLQKEKAALEQQLQTLEIKYQKKEEALQSKTKQAAKMAADLDKLKKMQEMIQSISAGMV